MQFSKKPSSVLHIDFNSCFASIEQQANPLLRGKPIVVAAYSTHKGCILAASREAKQYGIKTGTLVYEAKAKIPQLIVLTPDPMKYRIMHHRLKALLSEYSWDVTPKSIDEFVVHFGSFNPLPNLHAIALEIKARIRAELGEWLTVSIGLAANEFLAKQAAIFEKPDGLHEINHTNYSSYYSQLNLTDLTGISYANQSRLNSVGIYSVSDMYAASISSLRNAFHGICGNYWYLRLRGYEIDQVEHRRRMFGAMYSLPHPATTLEASGIIDKLLSKAGTRMIKAGYSARGIQIYFRLKNHTSWHNVVTLSAPMFQILDLKQQIRFLMRTHTSSSPITKISLVLFDLQQLQYVQLGLLENTLRRYNLGQAILKINEKYGLYGITPATMHATEPLAQDFIGFGNVKDLEQFIPE